MGKAVFYIPVLAKLSSEISFMCDLSRHHVDEENRPTEPSQAQNYEK